MAVQIVLAWTETVRVWDGVPYARDLGARPSFREELRGVAAMWLRSGDAADEKRARGYADKEGYLIFAYPTSERHPLEAARKAAVAREQSSQKEG